MSSQATSVVEVHLPAPKRRLSWAVVGLSIFALGAIAATIVVLIQGEWLAAFLGVLIVVLFGGWALTPWVNSRPGVLRFESNSGGVSIPGSDFSRRFMRVAVWLAPVGPLLLVAAWAAGAEVPWTLAIGLGASALLAIFGHSSLKKWRPASIALYRDGVTVEVPYKVPYHLRWDDVLPLPDTARPLARTLARPRPPQLFAEQELDSDPVLVAHLVEFYRTQPQLRAELHTEAVRQRIESGAFIVAGQD